MADTLSFIGQVNNGLAFTGDGTATQLIATGSVAAKGDKGDRGDTGLPGIPGTTDYNALTNKPALAAVATSGSYTDLTGKPTIPTVTGTNTGDETATTIKTKLGITTLSGANTGDQDLSSYATTASVTPKADKTYVDSQDTSVATTAATNLSAHTGRTDNPHSVTKAQVGLGSVDNTSDASKPVSTATSTALASKEPAITAGTSAQYWRGDKTMQTLNQDAVPDGTTNKAYSATDKTKLAGIATAATANSPDATLLARANHTGTQTASTISDFSTAADARVATKITNKLSVGTTAPGSPATNDLWIDTN